MSDSYHQLVKEVCDFYKINEHLPTRTDPSFNKLGKRLNTHLYQYQDKESLLYDIQVALGLEDLPIWKSWAKARAGFSKTGKYEARWNASYELLKDLKKRKGTTKTLDHKVPGNSNDSIAMRWAYRQASKFKSGQLSETELKQLRKIGFLEEWGLTDADH